MHLSVSNVNEERFFPELKQKCISVRFNMSSSLICLQKQHVPPSKEEVEKIYKQRLPLNSREMYQYKLLPEMFKQMCPYDSSMLRFYLQFFNLDKPTVYEIEDHNLSVMELKRKRFYY